MKSMHLPIFKATLDLCIYIDTIVKNHQKYYRYGIGSEMRDSSRQMLYLLGPANSAKGETRVDFLKKLVCLREELKTMSGKKL